MAELSIQVGIEWIMSSVLGSLLSLLFFVLVVIIILIVLIGVVRRRVGITFGEVMKMIGLAALQSFFFMVIIKVVELFNVFYISILNYDTNILTAGELALVFFIIYILADFIGELFRLALRKVVKSLFVMVIAVSCIQFVMLSLLSWLLGHLNLMTVILTDGSGNQITLLLYVFCYLIPILLSELIAEYIRFKTMRG